MSSMCGLRPRFSWTTRIAGQLAGRVAPAAPGSRASCRSPAATRYSTYSVLIRLSSFGDLLRLGELRAQRVEQHRRRSSPPTANFAGAIEKAAAVDVAVHVLIEEIEQLLIEILRGLAFHEVPSTSRADPERVGLQSAPNV